MRATLAYNGLNLGLSSFIRGDKWYSKQFVVQNFKALPKLWYTYYFSTIIQYLFIPRKHP